MNSIRQLIINERKRLLRLSPTYIIQEQHVSFSSTTRSSLRTLDSSKTRTPDVRSKPTRAPAPPLSTTSSSSNDAVIKKPVTWPKPSEIPWQEKVVNSVNLIGRVKIPVQFEASPDGKNWAGTIISIDNGSEAYSSQPSFWIPVIFEGELAHVARCHLKEKDYVHVAGHLSVDVPPFKLSEVQASVQVMVHNIDFVQGFPQSKKISTPDKMDRWATKNSEAFEQENNGQLCNDAESSPVHNSKEVKVPRPDFKAARQSTVSWRDLLTNSKQWIDNRERKHKGLVKANYPDFSHKDTKVGMWLNKAPPEVLQGLGQLEFYKGLNTNVRPRKGEDDADSWKHLVENPNKWWDNRSDKKNHKAPDFKNKDSGKALWLGNAPVWALSSLPPLKT